MAREEVTLKISGIWTYEDVFSAVPEGSLSVATNLVIDQKNIASPRRGYERLPNAISPSGTLSFNDAEGVFSFLGYPHYHKTGGQLYYYFSNSWNKYPTDFVKPAGTNRSRFAASNKNIYVTSQNGVQKIAAAGDPIVDAGARPGYAADLTLAAGTGSLFTKVNTGYAYRILWGYKDVNNNLILGAPSSRSIILSGNTVLNKDVALSFQIPSNVTTDWFYQIYRTKVQDPATSIDKVGDQLFLAFEGNPTADQISQGVIGNTLFPVSNPLYVDGQPDELLGIELYTNREQEGILQANNEPPQCKDMALYQGHLFYANTTQKAAIVIQILGTGVDGLQNNDTITIGGKIFRGNTGTPDNTLRDGSVLYPYEFKVQTTTGSPSADVEITAKSLVSVVNKYQGTIDAYYYSEIAGDSTTLPGQIRLVERDYNLNPNFAVKATTAQNVQQVFTPNLGGAGQSAVAENNPNRIYYSKFQKPEAVPLLQYIDVGPANSPILRILPLRNSLLVFTQKEIYKIYGSSAPFSSTLQDNTTRLIAPDTAVVLNNAVYGMFDQGVCQVSEGNVPQVISRPIEGDLLALRGVTRTRLSELAFAVSYESDRKYILYLPFTAGDTSQAKASYVYNTVTNTWTMWDKSFKHGMIHAEDDKLYMVNAQGISRERKDYNERDIADEQVPVPTLRIFKGTFTDTIALQAAFPNGATGDEITRRAGFYALVVSTNSVWNWNVGTNAWVDSGIAETVPALTNVIYVSSGTLQTLTVGDIYYESDAKFSKITEIDPVNIRFFLTDNLDWSGGTWEAQKSIPCEMRWNPIYMGNPAILKQFSETTLITTSSMENLVLGFKGISSSDYEDISFSGTASGAWGLFGWGDVPWGGDAEILRYRTLVPVQKQRDSSIYIRASQNTIYNNFEISGLSIIYRVIGPRVVR